MNFQEITQFERKLYNKGIKYIAGIDEVGRGPLAGPFVVSAVILDLDKIFHPDFQKMLDCDFSITGNDVKRAETERKKTEMNKKDGRVQEYKINDVEYDEIDPEIYYLYKQIRDSKKVSPKKRDVLADFIKKEAISYSIEIFQPREVDEFGISELTQRAFFNAVQSLKIKPQYVLTDTFEIVKITKEHQLNIISGDNRSISIASASIVAKVFRDNIMVEMHKKYPIYGFDRHKGYGTKIHIEALYEYGPCEIHRKSFKPVKSLLL